MSKRVIERCTKIAKKLRSFESVRGSKALEEAFSSKTIAIVKYRVGLDDGDIHDLNAVAEAFAVSESWVVQAVSKVEKFLEGKNSAPRKKAPAKKVTKKAEEKVVETAPRMIAAGVFNLETGELRIECENEGDKAELTEAMKIVLSQVEKDRFNVHRNKVAEEARVIANATDVVAFKGVMWALVAGIIGGILVFADLTPGSFGSLVVAEIISLIFVVASVFRKVSLKGERRGLLKARKF